MDQKSLSQRFSPKGNITTLVLSIAIEMAEKA